MHQRIIVLVLALMLLPAASLVWGDQTPVVEEVPAATPTDAETSSPLSLSAPASEWLQPNIRDEVYDQLYYHYWDLREHLEDLQVEHSGIVQLSSIGRSVVGERDPLEDYGKLLVARVTNLSDPAPKPEVYIDGGHHGNEQLGMEVAVLLLDYLVLEYDNEPAVREFVDSHDIYILPMINPDGNTRDTRANANGVDLNRNYPFAWAGAGSGPASEPEVAANVDLFEAHDFRMYISMHTGIRYFLTPWGYTHDPTPDVEMYTRLEEELENLTGFPAGPAADDLYIARGTSLDYGYSLGMPSVTVEVDDEQWGLITVEEKQTRLEAAFIGSLYMMENFPLFGAYPVVTASTIHDAPVAGESLQVTFELTNAGFGPLRNGTFWLAGDGFAAAPAEVLVPDLGPGNTTTLNFSVIPTASGTLSLQLEGRYRPRLIVNSTALTLSARPLVSSAPPVETLNIEVGAAAAGLPGPGAPAGLVMLAAVALLRARRR